tara:strand:- start:5585 stop:6124 length:540 start_codon:yes stop_codon:yes gene_type:complete
MADDTQDAKTPDWFGERLRELNELERKFRRAYLGIGNSDAMRSASLAGVRPEDCRQVGAALEERLTALGLLVDHDGSTDHDSASPDEIKGWLTKIMRGQVPDSPSAKVRNQLAAATTLARVNGMLHKVKDVEVPEHLLRNATDEQLAEIAGGKSAAEVFGITGTDAENVVAFPGKPDSK